MHTCMWSLIFCVLYTLHSTIKTHLIYLFRVRRDHISKIWRGNSFIGALRIYYWITRAAIRAEKFQWSKKDWNTGEIVEIIPGGCFEINHNGSLTIMDAQPSHSGLYLVTVSNGQGSILHHTVQHPLVIEELSTQRVRRYFPFSYRIHNAYQSGEYAMIILKVQKYNHLCTKGSYSYRIAETFLANGIKFSPSYTIYEFTLYSEI